MGAAIDVPGAVESRADGPRRWLRFRREDISAAELIASVVARYRVRDLTIEEPQIETIVRDLYEAAARNPGGSIMPTSDESETV